MGWIPVEPVEPDPFWGPAAVPRLPRWDGATFYPLPHPGAGVPLLWRNAASRLRFAAVLAGLGLFSVFVHQASLLTQLVLGAPVFEEFIKFGLALLAVGWLPRLRGPAALPVVAVRMAAAWACGAGFGWLEHALSYSGEGESLLLVRMLFHGGAAGLSMACFTVLETLSDVRSRWFATVPSSFFHDLVNASCPLQLAAGLLAPGIDFGGLWVATVTALVAAATLAVPLARGALRAVVERQVAERLPALPESIRAVVAQAPAQT
jgi:hypothetical protein